MSRKRTVYTDAVLAFDKEYVKDCAESTQAALGMADHTDNRARRRALILILHRAMRTELTPTQREYCLAYYEDRLTMKQIAERFDVDESTVSRTLRRARRRLYRLLQVMAINRDESSED